MRHDTMDARTTDGTCPTHVFDTPAHDPVAAERLWETLSALMNALVD